VGAASGGRLTLWLVALAVLMASGATGIAVIGAGSPPEKGGRQPTTRMVGSSDQRPDGRQPAKAQAQAGPVSTASAAAGAAVAVPAAAAGAAGRYNVAAAHSPGLLRELAGPLAGTGAPSGILARGVDVAAAQHPGGAGIDWPQVAAAGYSFAAVKATEGDYYANPYYAADTAGAQAAGLQVTGYHVAVPNVSGGGAQADYAVRHHGHAADGAARPLELDVEYDPYNGIDHTNECYGLSAPQLVSWIGAFAREAQRLTGQAPAVYTTAAWWRACTGDSAAFRADTLWVASYGTGQPAYPAAWASWSYWQFTSAGTVPGIAASGGTDVSYAGTHHTAPFQPAAAQPAAAQPAAAQPGAGQPAAAQPAAARPGTAGSAASAPPVAEPAPSSPVAQAVAPAQRATAPSRAAPSPVPSG
jgi:lysozyme